MEFKTLHSLFLIFNMLLIIMSTMAFIQTADNFFCQVEIAGCNYKISLAPAETCQNSREEPVTELSTNRTFNFSDEVVIKHTALEEQKVDTMTGSNIVKTQNKYKDILETRNWKNKRKFEKTDFTAEHLLQGVERREEREKPKDKLAVPNINQVDKSKNFRPDSVHQSFHRHSIILNRDDKDTSTSNNYPFRRKRETMPQGKRGETPDHLGNTDIDRLTRKMKKLIEKLSVRVLRWWRKLDKKLESLEERNGRTAMTSANLIHGECSHGFQRLDNWPSCYLLTQFNATWYEAKEYCAAFDSDLVAMATVKEHYLLTFLIKNNPALAGVAGWWTSGSYLGNTKQWMWTSAFYTKPFTFIKWGDGMPRDDGSQCMLLRASDDHKWHDAICTERYNFICESEIRTF